MAKVTGFLRVVEGPAEMRDVRDYRRSARDSRPVSWGAGSYGVVIDLPAHDYFLAGTTRHYPAETLLWLPSVQRTREDAQGWVDHVGSTTVEV